VEYTVLYQEVPNNESMKGKSRRWSCRHKPEVWLMEYMKSSAFISCAGESMHQEEFALSWKQCTMIGNEGSRQEQFQGGNYQGDSHSFFERRYHSQQN